MYSGLSETCKDIKIDTKLLILTFFVPENPLYVFKLKFNILFLQCIKKPLLWLQFNLIIINSWLKLNA